CVLTNSTCFFTTTDCYPTDQRSYPTRRSSDLFATAQGRPVRSRTARKYRDAGKSRSRLPATGHRYSPLPPEPPARGRSQPDERRSEEHTSELQSRGQLLCRLLLAKKNTACLLL